jgi:two-component system, OmpR family, alkaline phosphatase synthesis response regulator PhoP
MRQKVLLVDDVSMFLELQKDYLELSAVNILTARDGKEALKLCQSERPALVFMDLNMPVMNGADCCRALKEDQRLKATKVILITSEGKDADRSLCLAAGCDAFLTKPLDRNIFLEAARKLLPAIDRRDKRVACHIKVKYRAFGVTLSGFITNLSKNGVYLATDHHLEQGAVLDLIFALPEPQGGIVQLRGRVAWLNTDKARQKPTVAKGFGVEFISPSEETAGELARFIEGELSIT